MKLLVSLSSYGDKNLHLLDKVVEKYKSYNNYNTTVVVHCTVPIQRPDIIQTVHNDVSTTCLFHRQDFIDKQDDYDLFLFAEYDILINEAAVDTYVKYSKLLPIDYCLGYLRYEATPVDWYFIDLWKNIPNYNYIQQRSIKIGEQDYFSTTNVHQAAYILTKEQLKFVITNTQYNISSLNGYGPELASSGIFASWPLGPSGIMKKVLPLNREDLETCFIHHIADCHTNPPGAHGIDYLTYRSNSISLNNLLTDLHL